MDDADYDLKNTDLTTSMSIQEYLKLLRWNSAMQSSNALKRNTSETKKPRYWKDIARRNGRGML